jgi:hypothetical protein
MQPEDISSYLTSLKDHSHDILFYDSYDTKKRIVYSYLADGLRQGEGVVYVYSEEKPSQIEEGMKSHGIDVETNIRAGNITIRACEEWYLVNGTVEPYHIINNWNEAVARLQARGLGLRAVGDTACFFIHDKVRELLNYEYELHKVLTLPMKVICAYNLKTIVDKGYADMIMPLVRAHGKAIFTAEGGSILLEPQDIEASDLEKLLDLEI